MGILEHCKVTVNTLGGHHGANPCQWADVNDLYNSTSHAEARTSPFSQFFKFHTHKLYILRHCANTVYFQSSTGTGKSYISVSDNI